jgi:hypothetical protein
MPGFAVPPLTIPALLGIGVGLWMLFRGLRDHVTATRIEDTSTSAIASVAVGEVRVSGIVEPAELLLTSPIQSAPCVYYRARIRRLGDEDRTIFEEERSVGFRVRDASGEVRVFPRGAAWDVPWRFDESTGMFGESPPGILLRDGPAIAPAEKTHEQLVADLLTVRQATDRPGGLIPDGGGWSASSGRRAYQEARLAPGDAVTLLGRVLPFAELPDPAGADLDEAIGGPASGLDDPEVAMSIAAARATGTLAGSAEEAWGNAAIEGFGIGRPVRPPELHPDADPVPIATTEERDRFERTFDLGPSSLVLADSGEVRLVIAAGSPEHAVGRHRDRTLLGLAGAALAIVAAAALAASWSGAI